LLTEPHRRRPPPPSQGGDGFSIGTGQCPVKRYHEFLRDLIITGRAEPGMIVSYHAPLSDASRMYKVCDKRQDCYTKIVLQP
jgi:glutathione-independent formaldehyde dehydrogenase